MNLCDRCGKEAKRLIELKDEYGGTSVCNSCYNEVNKAYSDFTQKHIVPMLEKRTEYVKSVAHGITIVD